MSNTLTPDRPEPLPSHKEESVVVGPKTLGPPPNGGLAAWSTVLGCWISLFVQFGLCNSFGVFQAYYEANLLSDKTPSDIAWIGTLQLFILFFGGFFVGRLLDAHDPHVLLVSGSFAIVLSFMMMSLCTEYYQLILCQGVLFGIGCCLTFQPSVACPNQWFTTKRPLASGITMSGSAVGGVIWPIVARHLFDHVGFEWGSRAIGFICLGLMTIASLLIKTRGGLRTPTHWSVVGRPIKELKFTLMTLSAGLSLFGAFVPFFFMSTYALTLGVSSSLAFYCISLINAGSVLGRLSAGFATLVDPYLLYPISSSLCSLFLFAFWIPIHTHTALYAFCAIYGFVAGLWVAIIPICVAHMSPLPEIGARLGLTWGLASFAALVGPPIAGAIVNAHPGLLGFRLAAVFAGSMMAIGSCLGFVVRYLVRREVKPAVEK